MGRVKRDKTTGTKQGSSKLQMYTKEQLASLPRPDTYLCPDIPIKVRRSLARRKALYRSVVKPIYYIRQSTLSPLYDNNIREKYIDQIFTAVHKIGQGCFGDVFQVTAREDSQNYAIKVTNDTHAFINFDEVRRLEKIPNHENCVAFYCAWQESSRLYIQMELCLTSLDKVLMVYHHIPEATCWQIFLDIAQGLKHLHSYNLVHLDIKPANIMITAQGVCKIGDFGLLIDLNEINQEILAEKQFGICVSEGDGKYVALEVLREKTYTKAGDIFSLGIMMLEIASDVALPGSGPEWVKIREGDVPTCYTNRKLSAQFRSIVQRMMLQDHTKRPGVDQILDNRHISRFLSAQKTDGRNNIVANWEYDCWQYANSHPDSTLDIPAVQVHGPSPPRRAYPINYIEPAGARVPLQEFNFDILEQITENEAAVIEAPAVASTSASATAQYNTNKPLTAARRLLFE